MQKLGLDYETLSVDNPNLVYLSITGYGDDGPLRDVPAVDGVMQAFTGLMHTNRDESSRPQRLDFVVIDVVTGLYGFQAISTALFERFRFNAKGRHVRCSLLASGLALQAGKIMEGYLEPGERAMYVPLGAFPTSDGFISLSVRRDDHFVALAKVLGRDDWVVSRRYELAEDRVALRHELIPLLCEATKKFTSADLSKSLSEVGVLNAEVNTYADVLQNAQVIASKLVSWTDHQGFDRVLPEIAVPGGDHHNDLAAAPRIGEHSLQILDDWGISPSEVTQLLHSSAISAEPGRPEGSKPR